MKCKWKICLDAIMKTDAGENKTSEIEAQAANLAGLVDYQDGSVVSKMLSNKKTGTVTLFSFDKGEGLSEHTAPFDALVYLVDGEAEVTISGKAHRIRQGDIILMPANHPHSMQAVSRFKMLLIMIRS